MAKYVTLFHVMECQLDGRGHVCAEFEKDLPHHDFLLNAMCEDWNGMHMEQYYYGILKGKLESAVMTYGKGREGESFGRITFTAAPGVRLSRKIRDAIDRQTSAQFLDGWGEGFFGYGNAMAAPDGMRCFLE